MTCTCNSGGSCYSSLSSCEAVCPTTTTTTTLAATTTPSSSGMKIIASIVGVCNADTEKSVGNSGTTNVGGGCSVPKCEVDVVTKKATCTVLYNLADTGDSVTAVHIHWNGTASVPANKFNFPAGSFSSSYNGKAEVVGVDATALVDAWSQTSVPGTFVNIHSSKNPLGAIAGILKISSNNPSSADSIFTTSFYVLVAAWVPLYLAITL